MDPSSLEQVQERLNFFLIVWHNNEGGLAKASVRETTT
jgi:hypothetical protein